MHVCMAKDQTPAGGIAGWAGQAQRCSACASDPLRAGLAAPAVPAVHVASASSHASLQASGRGPRTQLQAARCLQVGVQVGGQGCGCSGARWLGGTLPRRRCRKWMQVKGAAGSRACVFAWTTCCPTGAHVSFMLAAASMLAGLLHKRPCWALAGKHSCISLVWV